MGRRKHTVSSFIHVSELFSAMFTDIEVAQKFSMGKTKGRYMIIYGLVPYFKNELFLILFCII